MITLINYADFYMLDFHVLLAVRRPDHSGTNPINMDGGTDMSSMDM